MFSGVSVSFLGRLPCGSNIVPTLVEKADDEDTIIPVCQIYTTLVANH